MTTRLFEKYKSEIVPEMMKEYGFKNSMRVPKMLKIVLNMGVGEGTGDAKIVDEAANELSMIAGQRPVITKSKKSIAGFKLRQGMPVGCKVTLRGVRMYEFLDRMISVAVPRIRDFRGFPANSFDGRGSYSFGINEQTIFPEVDVDRIKRTQGMDITIVTNSKNKEEVRKLLVLMGFPFVKASEKK
jgi:large subunit ribosomal protein L5